MQDIAKIFRVWTLIAGLSLASQSAAWAHAFLYYSIPAVGSTITNSPSEVVICFTEHLDAHGSKIQVRNVKDNEVDRKDSHRDFKDLSLLKVSLPKLAPGTYKVFWKAFSVDGHQTQGHFQFTLK